MKPKSELRAMAIRKAKGARQRYTWSYDRDLRAFEVLDADTGDVIAIAFGAEIRDEIIGHLSGMNHQPAAWSRGA